MKNIKFDNYFNPFPNAINVIARLDFSCYKTIFYLIYRRR